MKILYLLLTFLATAAVSATTEEATKIGGSQREAIEALFEITLKATYESMNTEEAWSNKAQGYSKLSRPDGSYSPLMRMNGELYD